MTDTCKYRKRGKVCRKKAAVTLLGYALNTKQRSFKSVMSDNSIRNAFSYCSHCAKLIKQRCKDAWFVDDNGAFVEI